ncbi:interleukin-8-like [Nothoprocta perdicaria]|uniref:interleukin-8-like n=1 Tax=Nothoprocta perdicaria TaxID=30464 RepID=UPI000E1BFFC8|nr:interleukin-8-like [Nothoprocta perdicaria]
MERKIVAVAFLLALVSVAVSEENTGLKDSKCQCISNLSHFIRPKYIKSIQLIESGPHCNNVEIIATLKGGREVCLEPAAPWVRLITKAIREKSNKTESPV